jgi:hypothetical protein
VGFALGTHDSSRSHMVTIVTSSSSGGMWIRDAPFCNNPNGNSANSQDPAQCSGQTIRANDNGDDLFTCSGYEPINSTVNFWRNTYGADLHLGGATMFGAPSSGNVADAACLYIYNSSGSLRWSDCNAALKAQGSYTISSPPTLYQNEYIATQWVRNNCPGAGNQIDLVHFLWLY